MTDLNHRSTSRDIADYTRDPQDYRYGEKDQRRYQTQVPQRIETHVMHDSTGNWSHADYTRRGRAEAEDHEEQAGRDLARVSRLELDAWSAGPWRHPVKRQTMRGRIAAWLRRAFA